MNYPLLYFIPHRDCSRQEVLRMIRRHKEIKFVSLVGVDLAGNDTDEKIPAGQFLKDPESFYEGKAVQTDGSSVVFRNIATLNNAKVDMIADPDVNWYVDYNHENLDSGNGRPVGTLRIPAFLVHEGVRIDSRAILSETLREMSNRLKELFRQHPNVPGTDQPLDTISAFDFTVGTELEFWVKTPAETAQIEELSATQVMQENYWQRTRGQTRTALEQSILMLEKYGLHPEMGHKEVGGVKAQIGEGGILTHVLEQMEIDWRYTSAIQAADNDLLARTIIKEIFRKNGLDVTFKAKPIPGVAGSGKHTHVGIVAETKNGNAFNLFSPSCMNRHYLSVCGAGALMGFLKHYEVINPLISPSTDALNRLKPGFEAPVCIVCSLGHSPEIPSRNRTVLAGLVRDTTSPVATRFEIRSPNPFTNTYLMLASTYTAMLDGIEYAVTSGFDPQKLELDLSKRAGDCSEYLEKNRAYRSEEDVFEHFSLDERNRLFGKPPETVYENMHQWELFPEKVRTITRLGALNQRLVHSFRESALFRWKTEITKRVIPDCARILRGCIEIHDGSGITDLDTSHWSDIQTLRLYLAKDTNTNLSLFTRIRDSFSKDEYQLASDLFIELQSKMEALVSRYDRYRKNMIVH